MIFELTCILRLLVIKILTLLLDQLEYPFALYVYQILWFLYIESRFDIETLLLLLTLVHSSTTLLRKHDLSVIFKLPRKWLVLRVGWVRFYYQVLFDIVRSVLCVATTILYNSRTIIPDLLVSVKLSFISDQVVLYITVQTLNVVIVANLFQI